MTPPAAPENPELAAIAEPNIPDRVPTEESEREKDALEKLADGERIRRLQLENKQIKQDRKERRKYAHRIFCLISVWLSCVLALIIWQGFATVITENSFRLENSVLIAAITTTTGSVLGIAYFVKYIVTSAITRRARPRSSDVPKLPVFSMERFHAIIVRQDCRRSHKSVHADARFTPESILRSILAPVATLPCASNHRRSHYVLGPLPGPVARIAGRFRATQQQIQSFYYQRQLGQPHHLAESVATLTR